MSGPSDDDFRAEIESTVAALRAQVDRAIQQGDRAMARDAAENYRDLLGSALEADSPLRWTIAMAMAQSGARVREVFGTSAWDDVLTVKLPPEMREAIGALSRAVRDPTNDRATLTWLMHEIGDLVAECTRATAKKKRGRKK